MREPGASPGRSRRCEGRRPTRKCHWPTRPGRPRRGSPESEDLPRSPTRTPRGRRIRASQTHSLSRCFSWWRSRPAALAANVKIRVEGKTTTIFGPAQPTRDRRQRAPGARRRQHGRRVLLRDDDVELRRLRQPDRQVPGGRTSTGWVFKVNGVSPPVGADKVTLKDGDVVLWYYATFGPTGGPPTLELQRLPANCYVVQSVTDAGKKTRSATRDAHGRREALQDEERPRLHRQARAASSARPRPARSARTPSSDPARARRVRRPRSPRRLRRWRRRGGGDGDAVGHARPRRRGAARHEGRRGADADARARLEGRASRRATAAASSRRSTVLEGSLERSARLVLVRQRLRGRPERVVVPAARRRRRLARLPRLASGKERRASSSAPSRSRSCTATTGRRVPPPSASTRLADAGGASLRAEIGADVGRAARDACARRRERARGPRLVPTARPPSCSVETAGDPVQARARGDPELDRAGTRFR